MAACGGLFPLPAPSRNWGSAPGPAPQTPEGLEDAAPPQAPLLKLLQLPLGGAPWRGWKAGLRLRPRGLGRSPSCAPDTPW
ncbi:hypothetical protein FGK60_23100 [Streptomyces sp. DASNCL29]|nr:hypothetical protein FGK60_23100 [Streptomyces sp. DASNCL29]